MGLFLEGWENSRRWLGWPGSKVDFKKTILIVDDDADFCLYIKNIAEKQQIEVEKAVSAAEAQQLSTSEKRKMQQCQLLFFRASSTMPLASDSLKKSSTSTMS